MLNIGMSALFKETHNQVQENEIKDDNQTFPQNTEIVIEEDNIEPDDYYQKEYRDPNKIYDNIYSEKPDANKRR